MPRVNGETNMLLVPGLEGGGVVIITIGSESFSLNTFLDIHLLILLQQDIMRDVSAAASFY